MAEPEPVDSELTEPPLPHYTASGAPVRSGDRLAFTVWTVCVLLVLAISLASYLFGWYGPSSKPQ